MENIVNIPIIAVNYNTPDLIDDLLGSLRGNGYANQVYIIDGSAPELSRETAAVVARYQQVQFIPFGYNIHHGPGLTWAIRNLPLAGPVLFLDSDVRILKHGFLESLLAHLTPELYGVGIVTNPDLPDVPEQYRGIPYLSPACMLCNIEVVRQYPPPIKHGAPMVLPMYALAKAGKTHLVKQVDWVANDFAYQPAQRIFVHHDWQGTVMRTKGYHYDTRMTGEAFDTQLLSLMPPDAEQVIEFGCGSGALARAYKNINTSCSYTGVERDAAKVAVARTPCDFVYHLDAGLADDSFFHAVRENDLVVLHDTLEYMPDPWTFMARLRKVLRPTAMVVAVLPNMQHWSVQLRLARGADVNAGNGPLQRGQRHFFTRQTMFELFAQAGLHVTGGMARASTESGDAYLPAIRALAELGGGDPQLAAQDAVPLHYLLKAVPFNPA